MRFQPSYYRARLKAVMRLINQTPVSSDKNNDRVLLRNGYIPEKHKPEFIKILSVYEDKTDSTPLSFLEICSFNTWFEIHPEKIAGVEFVTTSREFPIMIKGTREEIIETISRGLSNKEDNRVRIAKVKAESKLKLLSLLNQ